MRSMHFATMARWIYLCLLIYFGFLSTAEGSVLTISPRPVYERVPVTVRCSLGIISQIGALNSVSVSRRLLSNPSTDVMIASAVTLMDGGKAVLRDVNNFGSRATVTGKSDNNDKSGSFVQIQLTGMTCSDSGEYLCVIGYSTFTGSPDTSESSDNITIQTKPGEIEIIVTPKKEFNPYVVNETVEFRCNGNVGNPAQSWLWQWKYAGDMTWMSYPYTDRIKDDPPKLSGCQNRGSSVLTHTVSLSDNTRMFRCIVGNNKLYSANFTINTQRNPVTDKTAASETSAGSADVGVIVGAVLGALAFLAIVIVLIYFLWYRRRNVGEDYKTDEDKHPENEVPAGQMTGNPTYETRPEPRNFRKKKGQANPALDEPHAAHNTSHDSIPYNYQNTGYAEDGGAMPMGSAV